MNISSFFIDTNMLLAHVKITLTHISMTTPAVLTSGQGSWQSHPYTTGLPLPAYTTQKKSIHTVGGLNKILFRSNNPSNAYFLVKLSQLWCFKAGYFTGVLHGRCIQGSRVKSKLDCPIFMLHVSTHTHTHTGQSEIWFARAKPRHIFFQIWLKYQMNGLNLICENQFLCVVLLSGLKSMKCLKMGIRLPSMCVIVLVALLIIIYSLQVNSAHLPSQ